MNLPATQFLTTMHFYKHTYHHLVWKVELELLLFWVSSLITLNQIRVVKCWPYT